MDYQQFRHQYYSNCYTFSFCSFSGYFKTSYNFQINAHADKKIFPHLFTKFSPNCGHFYGAVNEELFDTNVKCIKFYVLLKYPQYSSNKNVFRLVCPISRTNRALLGTVCCSWCHKTRDPI